MSFWYNYAEKNAIFHTNCSYQADCQGPWTSCFVGEVSLWWDMYQNRVNNHTCLSRAGCQPWDLDVLYLKYKKRQTLRKETLLAFDIFGNRPVITRMYKCISGITQCFSLMYLIRLYNSLLPWQELAQTTMHKRTMFYNLLMGRAQ